MNKQKIKEIVKFSIKQNIQSKWFVIFNIILLILMVTIANATNISNFLKSKNIELFDDEITIEYVDKYGFFEHEFEKMFAKNPKVTVKRVAENKYDTTNIKDNILIVEVDKDPNKIIKATITSKEGFDNKIYDDIIAVLEDARTKAFAQSVSVDRDKLEVLNSDVFVERVYLSVDVENSDEKQSIQFISTIIVYMISIFIFSKIANEIANEKVSKSIEYVLTSVTAKEYLLAKIISVTVVVIIQGIFVLVYYIMGNLINTAILMHAKEIIPTSVQEAMPILDRDIVIYICTLFVYSILTLILLSIIQAALSSRTTNLSEAGNTMTLLMVITIAAYMFTLAVINPYTNMSLFIYILSCIPLLSNYFVPAIMIIGQANLLQIIVSLGLLVISIPFAFEKCSKIFKNGVLDYTTKKASKKKSKKEISLKEEQALNLEKSKFRKLALTVGLTVILVLVLQIISEFLLKTLLTPLLTGILTQTQINFLLTGMTSIISFGIPYLFLQLYIKKDELKELPKPSKKDCWKMFFIAIVFVGLIQYIIIYAQAHWGFRNTAVYQILDVEGLDNVFTQIIYVLSIAVIPGIIEELFFRKGMIDLTRKYGDKFAIIFSSLIFAVSHLNLAQGVFSFFFGLVMGTLYLKTGTLKYSILIHILNNFYAAFSWIMGYNEWYDLYNIVDYVSEGILLFSILVLVVELIKKFKSKEKISLGLEGKLLPPNLKYMMTDYTFVLGAIFIAVAFMTTEVMLNLL